MKTEFKAKFLQYVSNRKKEEGFTLIELLVVIIIIGILAAIALPSFLSQANKAKQSEGKQYISSLNKGQQAFFVENNKFTSSVSELGIGLKTQTSNYIYSLTASTTSATSLATPQNTDALKGYTGGVGLVAVAGSDAKTAQSILCETTGPGTPTAPTYGASDVTCAGGMSAVTK
ncbi:MAG TPA: pesticin [Planktothrix sp. UBA10369]|nr:pesticin [Planktothrix sp. UBA10369]